MTHAANVVALEVRRPVRDSRQAALTLSAPAKEHETFEPDRVMEGIFRALDEVDLEPRGEFDVRWEPHGLSCGVFGERFRVFVHTWPEHALATLDVWVAGVRHEHLIRALETALGWRRTEHVPIERIEGRP